jgi:tetratricopeptide (TPR) repeat protein
MLVTTREYKAAGTALFSEGDFTGAAQLFTKAINNPVGKKNAILYSNRAACYYAMGRCVCPFAFFYYYLILFYFLTLFFPCSALTS